MECPGSQALVSIYRGLRCGYPRLRVQGCRRAKFWAPRCPHTHTPPPADLGWEETPFPYSAPQHPPEKAQRGGHLIGDGCRNRRIATQESRVSVMGCEQLRGHKWRAALRSRLPTPSKGTALSLCRALGLSLPPPAARPPCRMRPPFPPGQPAGQTAGGTDALSYTWPPVPSYFQRK